jgi:hypothetical protein
MAVSSIFAPVAPVKTPNTGQPANQADFLGEGVFGSQQAPTQYAPVRKPLTATATPVSGYNFAPKTVSGGAIYDPAAQQRAFDNGNIGGAAGATNMNPPRAAAPAPTTGTMQAASTSPLNYYMERSLTGMALPAAQQSQNLSNEMQIQGQNIQGQQQRQATAFNNAGQRFDAVAPQMASRLGAAPTALSTGQLGAAPTIGQIQNVAGRLGSTPQAAAVGNIAGRLGAAPTVGSVGGIAGQLGAAPSVGDVGNIQMAAGPGGIAGQLGNQGAANADQAGMLSRLNGFLDAPEGPSVAEAQLRQAQASNMADLIGAARSGRGGAGQQARALSDAMSMGTGIMSDTAGQLSTLRAQEEDMRRNRQLSAIGLGGEMSTAQRAQDIGFRGQNLQALQGDQGAALQGRGQDLQAAMANQGTQTQLEQLRAQTALGARGQNLGALQGDQSTALGLEGLRAETALGARGQNLSALQGDQGTQAQMALGNLDAALSGRGQNLAAMQGDQSTALGREGLAAQTALGARGQNLDLLQGNQQTALGARGQNASMLMSDADRSMAAQQLELNAGLGYGGLANQATGQGLNFLSQANQQGMLGQQMSNDMMQQLMGNYTSMANQERAAQAGVDVVNAQNAGEPGFWEQMALNTVGGLAQGGAGAGMAALLSDERAKTDISLDSLKAQLDDHLRVAPGYTYRYKPGFGEDPETERAGPMAQDLEKSPFGRDIVKTGPDGFRRVDAGRLALVNHAALASMRSELDELKQQLTRSS